jgi:hypothetical protein
MQLKKTGVTRNQEYYKSHLLETWAITWEQCLSLYKVKAIGTIGRTAIKNCTSVPESNNLNQTRQPHFSSLLSSGSFLYTNKRP